MTSAPYGNIRPKKYSHSIVTMIPNVTGGKVSTPQDSVDYLPHQNLIWTPNTKRSLLALLFHSSWTAIPWVNPKIGITVAPRRAHHGLAGSGIKLE